MELFIKPGKSARREQRALRKTRTTCPRGRRGEVGGMDGRLRIWGEFWTL